MPIHKRLIKNFQRALPELAMIAPFIPGIGPVVSTIAKGISAIGAFGGLTPGIAPPSVARPGVGSIDVVRRPRRTGPTPGFAAAAGITRAPQVSNVPLAVGRGVPVPGLSPAAARIVGRVTIPPGAPPSGARAGAPGRNIIQIPPVGTARTNQMSIAAALPALRAAAPGAIAAVRTVGRALTGTRAAIAGAGVSLGLTFGGGDTQGVCPVGFHLNKARNRVTGQEARTYCVRNRRLNVGNARAARRSVRRLKGARKLLRDIEKMMPSKPRARARAHATPSPIIHTG